MTTAIFTSPRYLLSKYGFRYLYFFWAYFRARASTQVEELSMFFCLWAALFCYVSVRGCRHERVRATCTAFDAASMAWRAAFDCSMPLKIFVDNWVSGFVR